MEPRWYFENKLRTFIIPHCPQHLNACKENKIPESNITPRPENEGSEWSGMAGLKCS